MVGFLGYYGWFGCLVVGFVIGLIFAVKNKRFAQWIHDKFEEAKTKIEEKAKE